MVGALEILSRAVDDDGDAAVILQAANVDARSWPAGVGLHASTPGTPNSISFGVVAMRRSSCSWSTWLEEARLSIAVSPVRLVSMILSSSVAVTGAWLSAGSLVVGLLSHCRHRQKR